MGDRGGLTVGSAVEARFGGARDWHKGRITSLRGQTVSIEYDDGDAESDVPRLRVRLPGQKQRQQRR